jgi:2-iminobutanoate/2-iminopropanoate deaminase
MALRHIVTKNAPAPPIPDLVRPFFDLFLFRTWISDKKLQFAQGVRAGPFLWTQGTLGALPDGTMVEGTVRITL